MRATTTQRTLDRTEGFVDLVLGDDDLVRAEFDALIAACWESPREPPVRRPSPPAGAWAARPPLRRSCRPGSTFGPVPTQRPDGRQRGPPSYPSRQIGSIQEGGEQVQHSTSNSTNELTR